MRTGMLTYLCIAKQKQNSLLAVAIRCCSARRHNHQKLLLSQLHCCVQLIRGGAAAGLNAKGIGKSAEIQTISGKIKVFFRITLTINE